MIEKEHIIELKHVSKIFDDDTIAVNDFNLYVRKGEFVTFLGPSGCGKSTTLRMIAGFDFPTKGEILLNGKDISSMPPNKRPINMVFQRYALFPHLDVFENVAFGLRLKKVPIQKMDKNGQPILKINSKKVSDLKDDIKGTKKNKHLTDEERAEKLASLNNLLQIAKTTPEPTYSYRKLTAKEISTRVSKGLKIVDLDSLEDRDVTTLSGGQQQRVAIARAIVNEPEILLLDEPLGALDLKMRKDMQIELKEMHEKLGITFIYVTHDQEEALTMSDTIVVMKDGVIQQIGTPKSIYDEPKNAFVADFIGESNIYNATMIGKMRVRFLDHNFPCLDDFPINEKVDVVVRPEDVIFVKDASKGMVKGTIITKIFKGVNYQYTVMVGKNELLVKDTHDFPINEEIGIDIEKDSIQIMKKDFTTNIYTDAWIDKNNLVQIDDKPFDCDITQLLPGSKLEDGNLISKDGKHTYNFNDADVVAEIALDKIDIIDDLASSECQAIGEIVDSVYKGDHYQYIIRTENDEDFVCITPYNYNLNDKVGVHVKPEDIKLRLKKEISEYEI